MAYAADASASFSNRSNFWAKVYNFIVAYGHHRAQVALRTHAI